MGLSEQNAVKRAVTHGVRGREKTALRCNLM